MRLVDETAINTLRKMLGSEADSPLWKAVEQQIADQGIDGLTGAAALAVESIVLKHGSPGDKGYAAMHPSSHGGGGGGSSKGESGGAKGGGGSSDSGTTSSGKYGSDSYVSVKGQSLTDDQVEVERRNKINQKSQDEIAGAKGNGLQPIETGRFTTVRAVNGLLNLSDHGDIMYQAELKGGTPRVKTDNGATAKILGWKHREDVAIGDTVAIPGGKYDKVPVLKITGVTGEGMGRRYTGVAIGKRGKPTGKEVSLQLGNYDTPVTIVQPRQT